MAKTRKRGRKAPPRARRKTLAPKKLAPKKNVAPGKTGDAGLKQQLAESRAQQAATAEILRVISRSPGDVQPVLEAVASSAGRLCEAKDVIVLLKEGDHLRYRVHHGDIATAAPVGETKQISRDWSAGRCAAEGRQLHIHDILAAPEEFPDGSRMGKDAGYRTVLMTPLLREGNVLGVVGMRRAEVRPFEPRQIELINTFAEQAVIAIENVRLFNETKEALEQQTAISEVLRVISGSPTDVMPVLEAVATRAARICEARDARIFLVEGSMFRPVAGFGDVSVEGTPRPLDRGSPSGRAILDRAIQHIEDITALPVEEFPVGRAIAERTGWRTILSVPLMRENHAFGTIVLRRSEVRRFTDKQVALLETFASQAAIAIENVRLFNETKEALEQQKASAEVLGAISSSIADTQPVFDRILQSCKRLFGSNIVGITIVGEDEKLYLRAYDGPGHEDFIAALFPLAVDRNSGNGCAIVDGRIYHVPDSEAEDVPEGARRGHRATHSRASIFAPMMWQDRGIGTIFISRERAGPFSEKEISLLKTFADQAVIAIQNARLFNETKEALERQTATAEILQVIGSSPTDTQPVFDAIVNSGVRLFPGAMITVARPDGGTVRAAAIAHEDTTMVAGWKERFTTPLSRDRLHAAAILDARLIDFPDAEAEKDGPLGPGVRNFLLSGNRAVTIMPMLRGEGAIGAISVTRVVPGSLSDKQIAILRTFANQAVIAIENVRLFNEIKEALEQQTATADILKVISSSPTDTQPVFEAIVQSGLKLFPNTAVVVTLSDGEQVRLAAIADADPLHAEQWKKRHRFPLSREYMHAVAILDRRVIDMPDAQAYEGGPLAAGIRNFLATGNRAVTIMPMQRADAVIGTISVVRRTPGPLTEKQIALLRTFADQAVIAVENVRLFKETQEALERLTATSEVLKVISSSPTDTQPVFDSIAERAATLCGAQFCSLSSFDGETIHMAAVYGATPEGAEAIRAAYPMKPGSATLAARVIRDRKPLHIADVQADTEYEGKDAAAAVGFRSVLGVPMLREGHLAGAIVIGRAQTGLFPENQVNLLTTFADQAVIAIENVRLFHEIEEKGRQLEVASQHKSNFLASMSHELRTPLNAILGFNEMILGQVYGEVPADMQEPLNDIQTSGRHLLRLINNVLDLAKIEAGRMELSLQDYSVHDAVESVRSTLRPLAADKGLEFLASVPNDLPLAYGDGGRIVQCLMNLAGNSLKFTKAGKVEISVETKGELLVYKVTDTGIGIPPDKIGSLFTEFKQSDATIASEYGGTGLGLSISRKFVEMHGGRIWVESEPGKGSAFIFEVPLRAKTT